MGGGRLVSVSFLRISNLSSPEGTRRPTSQEQAFLTLPWQPQGMWPPAARPSPGAPRPQGHPLLGFFCLCPLRSRLCSPFPSPHRRSPSQAAPTVAPGPVCPSLVRPLAADPGKGTLPHPHSQGLLALRDGWPSPHLLPSPKPRSVWPPHISLDIPLKCLPKMSAEHPLQTGFSSWVSFWEDPPPKPPACLTHQITSGP